MQGPLLFFDVFYTEINGYSCSILSIPREAYREGQVERDASGLCISDTRKVEGIRF